MANQLEHVLETANRLILDKQQEVKLGLTCLLAQGHLLIEDLPGVGKTTMVQVMGKLLGLEFSRLQFTSDLLPADIIGNTIYDEQNRSFQFHQGPLFAQLVLADELNRANPRTQSALLQAMEEGEVAVDGKSKKLPVPFFVIATQNPSQQVGTFPLPESQLDRFMMSLELNFASKESEMSLIQGFNPRKEIDALKPSLTVNEFILLQRESEKVEVSKVLARYISDLMEVSRKHSAEFHPLSTRAGISIGRAAKAYAFLNNRSFATPDDVQAVGVAVMGHRLCGLQGIRKGKSVAEKLIKMVPVPL